MRALVNLGRMLGETLVFGVATRRISLVLVVLGGLLLVAVAATAQAAAPLVLYPFA